VFSFPKRHAAVRISQRMILYTRVVELRVYEPGYTAPKINSGCSRRLLADDVEKGLRLATNGDSTFQTR
jgi:hypothetical protein